MKNTRERKKNFRSPFVRTKKKKLSLTLGLETNQTNTKNSYPKQKSRGSRTTRTWSTVDRIFFHAAEPAGTSRNQNRQRETQRSVNGFCWRECGGLRATWCPSMRAFLLEIRFLLARQVDVCKWNQRCNYKISSRQWSRGFTRPRELYQRKSQFSLSLSLVLCYLSTHVYLSLRHFLLERVAGTCASFVTWFDPADWAVTNAVWDRSRTDKGIVFTRSLHTSYRVCRPLYA